MRKKYQKVSNEMFGYRKTSEKVEITYGGWDGKSYNGEGKRTNVWVCDKYPGKKFVHIRKTFSSIYENYKADCFHEITDKKHRISGLPVVEYFDSELTPYEEVEC